MIKLIKIKDQGWKIQICDKRGAFSLNICQQKPFNVHEQKTLDSVRKSCSLLLFVRKTYSY